MKAGEFAKYKGKEFAASVYHGVVTLFSVDLLDIERYEFEECESFDMPRYGIIVCEKEVKLSEVDEYYLIRQKAIYKGYIGGIGRPNKENNVVIGFGWDDMTREEALKLGMEVGHGDYYKEVSIDDLELFEERKDYDIQQLITDYEQHEPSITDNDEDLLPMLNAGISDEGK